MTRHLVARINLSFVDSIHGQAIKSCAPTCRKPSSRPKTVLSFLFAVNDASYDLGKWASGAYKISVRFWNPEVLEGISAARPDQTDSDDELCKSVRHIVVTWLRRVTHPDLMLPRQDALGLDEPPPSSARTSSANCVRDGRIGGQQSRLSLARRDSSSNFPRPQTL